MRIIFACGGTAGHINPALAVAGRIKELMPDSEFLFIGAVGQMESDLVPRAGYKIETVRVRGLSREKTIAGFFHNISATQAEVQLLLGRVNTLRTALAI